MKHKYVAQYTKYGYKTEYFFKTLKDAFSFIRKSNKYKEFEIFKL